MFTKMKNIRKKVKKKKKSRIQKISRGMDQGKQQPTFERNPCNRFRDNGCHNQTNGWTTVEFRFHELC